MRSELLWYGAAVAPVWPALAAALIGLLALTRKNTPERPIAAVSQAALFGSALSMLCALVGLITHGPAELRLGHWFTTGQYGFELIMVFDELTVAVGLTVVVLLLATGRFSVSYLHREPGFARFFGLTMTFCAAILLVVLSGTYDLLFAGWEVVGMTSVLLVGYFHERQSPIRAAARVLVTYRLCDVGLLFAALLLHNEAHTSVISQLAAHPSLDGRELVGLLLLFGAMGKSAQFPVGGWLPRAMEGPTASSAVFYGALSVHAGVFLLLRSWPLLEHAPIARAAIVGIGLATALQGTLSGQVCPDAKTALVYATISQVGIMFAECGLGFRRLALAHMIAHTFLRYYQFLRTPSTLQDALDRRAALGRTMSDELAARWDLIPITPRRYLYRLAIERFEVEAALERFVERPVMWLSQALYALERRSEALFEPTGRKVTSEPPQEGSATPRLSLAPPERVPVGGSAPPRLSLAPSERTPGAPS